AMDLKARSQRSLQAVRASGVNHGDEHDANLLWNAERCSIMVIDFDCAVLRQPLNHTWLSVLPGVKRKR
ncbi:hypothetical protein B0I35DRAFT_342283, partial [Stachybotrys elegans]